MTTYVALDTETANLAARYDARVPLWCISFAYRTPTGELHSVVYKWDSDGQAALANFLSDDDVVFVVHNAAFDIATLRVRGVHIPQGKFHDTLLMSYLANTAAESHSLEKWGDFLGYPKIDWRGICVRNEWIEERSPSGSEYAIDFSTNHVAYAHLQTYCKRDTEVALKLYEYLWEREYKHDKKLLNAYTTVELPYVEAIIEMENTGLFLDKPRLTQLGDGLSESIELLEKEIAALVPYVPEVKWDNTTKKFEAQPKQYKGGFSKNKNNARHYTYQDVLHSSEPSLIYDHCVLQPFNPNSSSHLSWALMRDGWKPKSFSKKTNEPKCDSEVVDELDFPLAKLYSQVNELAKLKNTFVDGLLTSAGKGCVARGNFNQCLTITTRLSSSKPNLQNLPASGVGVAVREAVIAPPGYDIVVGDLDAIELRVLAYYLQAVCGDTTMADAIRAGADLHTLNAEKWGISRKQAKTTIFGLVYGQTAKGLAGRLGVKQKEAEQILKGVYEGTPSLEQLMSSVHSSCRARGGKVYTLLGQRLYYPDINSNDKYDRARAERQVQNAVIQGSAAAINKELHLQAMAYSRRYGARSSCVVHDELLFYVPSHHTDEFCNDLNTKVYNNTTLLAKDGWCIPVTATFHKGLNWLDAKNA